MIKKVIKISLSFFCIIFLIKNLRSAYSSFVELKQRNSKWSYWIVLYTAL